MTFTSIEQIKRHPFAGNFHSDAAAFKAIEEFVHDQAHSLADRAEAIRQLTDRGMGCGRDEEIPDRRLVELFVDEEAA